MNSIDILDNMLSQLNTVRIRHIDAGETVFHQGDPACHIFAVETGCIKMMRYTVEGRAVVLHVARSGENFAEAALFSDIYHCHAVADTASAIRCYPKQAILHALSANPDHAQAYITLLSSQVRTLRTRLELRNILSARDRILHALLLMADPTTGDVNLTGTLKDLASELGLAHETLYRELAQLEREGAIIREPARITITKKFPI